MQMQADLTALGYYTGEVDGYYGPNTEAAVKAFQKDNGLKVTGEFDQATIEAIDAAMKHPTASPSPTTSASPAT
jgi:peptidoglycan hydrolase-like protein with peptidoglycan-binding domain